MLLVSWPVCVAKYCNELLPWHPQNSTSGTEDVSSARRTPVDRANDASTHVKSRCMKFSEHRPIF